MLVALPSPLPPGSLHSRKYLTPWTFSHYPAGIPCSTASGEWRFVQNKRLSSKKDEHEPRESRHSHQKRD